MKNANAYGLGWDSSLQFSAQKVRTIPLRYAPSIHAMKNKDICIVTKMRFFIYKNISVVKIAKKLQFFDFLKFFFNRRILKEFLGCRKYTLLIHTTLYYKKSKNKKLSPYSYQKV